MVLIFKYCRTLSFEQEPDYEYIKQLLKDIAVHYFFKFDYDFEWSGKAASIQKNINIPKDKEINNKGEEEDKDKDKEERKEDKKLVIILLIYLIENKKNLLKKLLKSISKIELAFYFI